MLWALLPFSLPANVQTDWRLVYEQSGFVSTGDHQEAVDYCRRLDAASDEARAFEFGVSPEGRPMVALLLSKDSRLNPTRAQQSSKPLIIVCNGIHSGEIEGKDASLILARNIVVNKRENKLLDKVNILIVPIFSVDAHERRSPYNRINQNGPKSMGWRATSTNLNLNRDWIKADGEEMKAMLRLVRSWEPDFFIDNHTTNGADYQYSLLLGLPTNATQDRAVADWTRAYYEEIKRRCDEDEFLTAPYFGLVDQSDPTKGINVQDFSPRFSTGYFAARNRPTLLVETHMLKPYKQRVEATYSVVRHTLAYVGEQAQSLKSVNKAADEAWKNGMSSAVLSLGRALPGRPFTFKGYAWKPYRSEISGATIPGWDRTKPQDFPSRVSDTYEPGPSVPLPTAYAVPRQYKEVIALLDLHGIEYRRTRRKLDESFDSYKFEEVTFGRTPFESRFSPVFKPVRVREPRILIEESVVVPTNQKLGKLVAHLFEPSGPDSLMRWGFFNSVFEQKEYAENYAMEPYARKMLAEDPRLRAEFEERLKDPQFAGSPQARLQFFFERSPYYDQRLNKYPVVMLNKTQMERLFR